nr:ATP-binding protein [Fredinandcohnia sp. SECRCQ15]
MFLLCSCLLLIGAQLFFFEYELELVILFISAILLIFAIWESRKNLAFRSLVEDAPYAIAITKDKQIVYINSTGKFLLGADKMETYKGKSIDDFIHHDSYNPTRKVERGHKFKRIIEGRINHPILKEVHVEQKSMPIVFQRENCEYVVIRDITEVKKSQELIQQSDKLSMVGELAAGIAHEIRNPLTSVKGFAQLVQHGGTKEELNSYSEIMKSEIDRINGIVGELLFLAKPKKRHLKEFKISTLIQEVVFLLNTEAILHNIQIKVDYLGEMKNIPISCEESKIKQVFINLIKNSIEAMDGGGVIHITIQSRGKNVILRFADEGCGIPEDVLMKIGNAFYTTKEKGTGLGLMVCHSIIQDHGGKLKFESREGQGTVAEVVLPIYQ